MNPQDEKIPDEIDLLLPWHAVERLSPDEAERVEAAIARDPERARHLEIAREERAETVALNQDLGLPSSAARDSLFARIAADGARPRTATIAARLRSVFAALSPGTLAWSGAAAALVIAVQAGFLASAYLSETRSGYETAAAPSGAASQVGVFGLIVFVPNANAGQIEALLREARATIVDGPRAGGFYRLRIADGATGDAGAVLDRLRTRTDVVRIVVPERQPGSR